MKPNSTLRRFLPLPAMILGGAALAPAVQAADLSYNTGATLTLTGAASYDNVNIGLNGGNAATIVNATGTTSFTSNGTQVRIGVSNGSSATGVGTLQLGANNSITASTWVIMGGTEVEANANVNPNNLGTVTTVNGGSTTIATPYMALGTNKGTTGSFTIGAGHTLNLGTTSARTALILGRKLTNPDNNISARTVGGIMNLGAGVANLNLSSLRLSYNTAASTGNYVNGTLTLSDSASNKLNIVGTGNVVAIGFASGLASSFTGGTATGLLTIGNLHADSYIESTDNSTAIVIGAKPSGAGTNVSGTLDFKAGAVTIKTAGAAIAGDGNANTRRLTLGETGNVTLIAGADSSNWIHSLTVAEIKSNGLSFDTNGKTIGIAQAFTGAGGLTLNDTAVAKGTLALSGANLYAGGTTVSNGRLLVNNSNGSGTGSGAVNVASAATLGGTGSISGAVAISDGGILAPGASIESLAITGGLSMANGAIFEYEYNSSRNPLEGAAGDLLTVDGGVSLGGALGTVVLDLHDLALAPTAFADGTTLSLIQYTGSLNGGFFYDDVILTEGAQLTLGGNTWTIHYAADTGGANFMTSLDGSSFITLTSSLTAIPEPGSLLALGCLVGSGLFLRSRRRR